MITMTGEPLTTDVLVIGGGAAGLQAAISARASGASVLLASESPVGFKNNTAISGATIAAGGILVAGSDSPEAHLEDTLAGGCFVNDRTLVATVTAKARERVLALEEYGVSLRRREGELRVTQAPGHRFPRHVSAEASNGINISRPMRDHAARAGVEFLEGVLVTRLVRSGDVVAGALVLDRVGRLGAIQAGCTILATGGAGQIFDRTNNPTGTTGDGYALAYDLGATLRDMEFVQFYPTATGAAGARMCFYEQLIPLGAVIRNASGEDICDTHGMGDFSSMTRDRLARAIMQEIADGRGIDGCLLLDLTGIPEDRAQRLRLGRLVRGGDRAGRVLVAPTTHHFMGGIRINERAHTGIGGLYAAGEVCGGVQGANRLAGNALAEVLVFGAIAGAEAAAAIGQWARPPAGSETISEAERLRRLVREDGDVSLDSLRGTLRQTMWQKAGVIRERRGLQEALAEIDALQRQLPSARVADSRELWQAVKLRNMLTVAEMVCRSAFTRTESRGAHFRSDNPNEDPERWLQTVLVSRQDDTIQVRVERT